MKKRFLSMLLALCMAWALLPGMALAAREDLTAYLAPLRTAMEKNNDDSLYGEAMLCDLDGAGQPELVLVYTDDDLNASAVVSVYTIRDGKAAALLEGEPLFVMAGGNMGYVGEGEDNGQPILLTVSEMPEVLDDTVAVEGVVKLYRVADGKLQVFSQATYREVIDISDAAMEKDDPVLYDESSCVIDGKALPYVDYLDWRGSYPMFSTNVGFPDPDWDDDAVAFSAMENYLATGFWDVPAGSYYAPAVTWAVRAGVTQGTGTDTFSPGQGCTRAQFVTFLWRSQGQPKAAGENPFRDVQPGAYYYDAVLWAAEQGITQGTGADAFSPGSTLTRAQVVTFLWRLAGSPEGKSVGGFRDVRPSAYYAPAVDWAVQTGVTQGTGETTFAPGSTCTRAQTVTFLYRALGET